MLGNYIRGAQKEDALRSKYALFWDNSGSLVSHILNIIIRCLQEDNIYPFGYLGIKHNYKQAKTNSKGTKDFFNGIYLILISTK